MSSDYNPTGEQFNIYGESNPPDALADSENRLHPLARGGSCLSLALWPPHRRPRGTHGPQSSMVDSRHRCRRNRFVVGTGLVYDVVLKRRSAELLGWAGRLASNKSIDSLDDFLIQIVWSVPLPPSVSVDCKPELY